MADLFELTDLAASLQADLDTASAAEARRKATAWLASATRLTEWPTPVPEDIRAWALELAGLVYDNPSNLESESDGHVASVYARRRRAEILAEARTVYGVAGPSGSYPAAEPFPDPVYPWALTRRYYLR